MKKAKEKCDIKSCYLCSNCSAYWLPAIESQRLNFYCKRGESIFKEGDKATGLYFIYKGKVKVHREWGEGKQLILRFAKPGDILGYRGMSDQQIFPVSATALEDSTLCFVNNEFFENTLQSNPPLAYKLMKLYANELMEAEQRMGDLAHRSVKIRIAQMLHMLQKDFGKTDDGSIAISLNKHELAFYAGTTYETFFRVMTDLTKRRIVKVRGKNIIILKERILKSIFQNNK